MFIAFEGIDSAGKSTLSVKLAEYLNSSKVDGLLRLDPHFGDFIWTKEPSFSIEEARLLNSPGYVDEYRRERVFFESRLRHQNIIAAKNIICEQYLWSGLAYAYKFSPNCFRFIKELYSSEKLFVQPDLYIFIDTPIEICLERDPSLDIDNQRELQEAYQKTSEYIKVPTINFQAVGDEQESLHNLIVLFEDHVKKCHIQ
jgi:thymidylate kinase